MSLYNMLHGVNPMTALYLAMIGVRMEDIPRFRDTFVFKHDESYGVAIYTRTGGGNREDYASENDALAAHPLYLWDEDDDFDCTYATFHFRVPEAFEPMLAEMAALGGQTNTPAESWERTFRKLHDLKPGEDGDEETRHWLDVGRPIVEQIMAALAAAPTPEES